MKVCFVALQRGLSGFSTSVSTAGRSDAVVRSPEKATGGLKLVGLQGLWLEGVEYAKGMTVKEVLKDTGSVCIFKL